MVTPLKNVFPLKIELKNWYKKKPSTTTSTTLTIIKMVIEVEGEIEEATKIVEDETIKEKDKSK